MISFFFFFSVLLSVTLSETQLSKTSSCVTAGLAASCSCSWRDASHTVKRRPYLCGRDNAVELCAGNQTHAACNEGESCIYNYMTFVLCKQIRSTLLWKVRWEDGYKLNGALEHSIGFMLLFWSLLIFWQNVFWEGYSFFYLSSSATWYDNFSSTDMLHDLRKGTTMSTFRPEKSYTKLTASFLKQKLNTQKV